MAKARAIVKRRKAVQNIRKITRTMQLIATARFQAAFGRATRTKPYTERITQLVAQVARNQQEVEHPLLRVNSESGRWILFAVTSNRGLCGGYNSAVTRASTAVYREMKEQGRKVDIFAVGKKLIGLLKFIGLEPWRRDDRYADNPQYADIEAVADELMTMYERREIDGVRVTYTRFISAGVQRVETIQLLPLEPPPSAGEEPNGAPGVQWEFLPEEKALLAELLPEMVRVRLFQCFIDAAVSEQVARMVAMKAATDAANDMVRSLTQQYNRARQSQITLELLDIVGGAEALQ